MSFTDERSSIADVIRRLVERYADFDQTGFIGFVRFDGELLDTGAVKHLAHPAT